MGWLEQWALIRWVDGVMSEPGVDIRAFVAWFIASAAGYLAAENIFTILGIASMDTILVASIVYGALKAPRIYEQWAAVKPLP